jgi:ankyrin repeat protein
MDVYVPILGLEKYGLDPIQLLEIRNLDAPGGSTLPPATNVNSSLVNLLLHIDSIYATQKKREIKHRKKLHAVFRFPNLTNPEIFQGQHMLQSLGLGLITKAYDFTKKSRCHARFDFICATGVIKKYPTENDIIKGDFLDDSTGDIESKLVLFITYIKENNLSAKRAAFIYSGKSTEEKLARRLKEAGLCNVEVKRADNFIQIVGYLFEVKAVKSLFFIIPPLMILAAGIFFLLYIMLPADPCLALLEAVKTKNTKQINRLLRQCDNLEIKDSGEKTALIYALDNKDIQTAGLLIDRGAEVNLAAWRGNRYYIEFLRKACSKPIFQFPALTCLEEQAVLWGVYWEDNLPHFCKANLFLTPTETTKEKVLQLSLLGGEPYAFAHFYLNLQPENTAQNFLFSTDLKLLQETTYNNFEGDSRVQALEVSVNKFYKEKRYELALQWQNVGMGAPQWRYWEPEKGWVGMGLSYELKAKVWHTLCLAGRISNDSVYYTYFTIDGQKYSIDKSAASTAVPYSKDFLAVALQLDGNYKVDPYTIYVKNINLEIQY